MSQANNTFFRENVFDIQTNAYYTTDYITSANVCKEGEGTSCQYDYDFISASIWRTNGTVINDVPKSCGYGLDVTGSFLSARMNDLYTGYNLA